MLATEALLCCKRYLIHCCGGSAKARAAPTCHPVTLSALQKSSAVTCELHLGLPGFADGLKLGDLDARHVFLAGVDLERRTVHVVKHCVLDAVTARIPAHSSKAQQLPSISAFSCLQLRYKQTGLCFPVAPPSPASTGWCIFCRRMEPHTQPLLLTWPLPGRRRRSSWRRPCRFLPPQSP